MEPGGNRLPGLRNRRCVGPGRRGDPVNQPFVTLVAVSLDVAEPTATRDHRAGSIGQRNWRASTMTI